MKVLLVSVLTIYTNYGKVSQQRPDKGGTCTGDVCRERVHTCVHCGL